MSRYRITVDTGGTFSDFVYFDDYTGVISIAKLPSTPTDPSEAIIQGVQALLQQGVKPDEIEYFCHGTTVGTNALLEEKGAVTGLLVTAGFRGIYEVMEQARPYGAAIFDVTYDKPRLLVPPSRTGEVIERVDFEGKVLRELDEEDLRGTLRAMSGAGVESIAVCLLFSFLHPEHEKRVRQIMQEELPACNVSLSSEILPQIREYYRLSTTVINAYLQPILERYINRLEKRLAEEGIKSRKTYIMQSNGGTATFQGAAQKAVTTVLSGPAGGVTACAHLSKAAGYKNLITFDMGGTSCDVSLIKDGRASISNRGKIDGRDIAVPMMDINTISAGGGTIVRVDSMGVLEVGPDSAGAVPGPACYCKGGRLPTITDANLLLGFLSETNFLGGRMELDRSKAKEAFETYVAGPLKMGVIGAAEGVNRIINVKMEEAIKAISTARGYDLRDFMLVAFGGAGPIHAAQMARDLGMKGVIVPLYPGVYSAMGLLMTEVKRDYIRSKLAPLNRLNGKEITLLFAEMEGLAGAALASEGFNADQQRMEYALDMRYAGQGYEITVPVVSGAVSDADLAVLRKSFDITHKQLFGHMAEEELVEVVSYRLTGIGQVPKIEMPHFERRGSKLEEAYSETRSVYFDGLRYACSVYDRGRIDVGLTILGPAVIEQLDSTTVVCPGQIAKVDEMKNIIIMERGLAG